MLATQRAKGGCGEEGKHRPMLVEITGIRALLCTVINSRKNDALAEIHRASMGQQQPFKSDLST